MFGPGHAALAPPDDIAVRIEDLSKTYGNGASRVDALRGITIDIPTRSFTAIMGPSGSGKSTMLHCVAGLDRPTAGRIVLDGTDISSMSTKRITSFRRDRVGFVFQAYNLVPHLSVRQNVSLPLILASRAVDQVWFDHVIAAVGLTGLADRMPHELSGGQQQRAAIARALVTRPAAVFGDEPTGALDSQTARTVLELLRTTASALGQTVVIVTHDPVAASYADRVVFLADGRLAGCLDTPTVDSVVEQMLRLGEA